MIDLSALSSNQLAGIALLIAGAVWMAWQRFGDQAIGWWRSKVPAGRIGTADVPDIQNVREGIDRAIQYAQWSGNVRMEECLRSAGAATYTVPKGVHHDHDGEASA